ncbi:hypothetical protein AH140_004351 [Salmonella enterica subsp. enterica]|nr:hypothetical protein [Salmonella enterica subsp. enterica serovar Bahrenfeld]
MATGAKNAKSQALAARVPHEVIEGMESVKSENESTANFIVTAMRGEITRRQLNEDGENQLLSKLDAALQALAKIEEIGERAGTDIRAIVDIAHAELEARQRKKSKDNPDQ